MMIRNDNTIDFGCMMMMIARSSHARNEKKRREMKEQFEVTRRGMQTTVEGCDLVRKMSHHINNGLSEEYTGHERLENNSSIWAGTPRRLPSTRRRRRDS